MRVIYGLAQMRSDAAERQEGVTALVTPIGHTVLHLKAGTGWQARP